MSGGDETLNGHWQAIQDKPHVTLSEYISKIKEWKLSDCTQNLTQEIYQHKKKKKIHTYHQSV